MVFNYFLKNILLEYIIMYSGCNQLILPNFHNIMQYFIYQINVYI